MPDTDTKTVFAGEMRDAMRNWVTASDASRHDYQAEGLIRMDIRHNHLEQRWHDLRFCLDSSIFSVKEKLHKHGAGSVAHMELYLRRYAWKDSSCFCSCRSRAWAGTGSILATESDPGRGTSIDRQSEALSTR